MSSPCEHGHLRRFCEICRLERENKRLREALERIADNGGIHNGGMTYNGLWCAKLARDALKETA